jgi:hypothetical protein
MKIKERLRLNTWISLVAIVLMVVIGIGGSHCPGDGIQGCVPFK